jgi:predicted transcriptional regulator
MTPKLTAEQREALIERGAPVAVQDEENHRVYFLVDPVMFDALRNEADIAALLAGIADADAGRTAPLDEATQRIEARLRARFSA